LQSASNTNTPVVEVCEWRIVQWHVVSARIDATREVGEVTHMAISDTDVV
jgi:hypothetical protein